MSNLNGRKLSFGKLHGPIHTAQTGNIKDTLIVGEIGGKVKSMTIQDTWVSVEFSPATGGPNVIVLIPNTGFTHTVMLPE